MKNTFVNLTNHPSEQWSEPQRAAALEYGPIIDVLFPAVPESADLAAVTRLVYSYFEQLKRLENPVVLIQGESVFVYTLVRLLEQARIPALAAVNRRQVQETRLRNGATQKTAVFLFAGFRPYWESGLDALRQNDV